MGNKSSKVKEVWITSTNSKGGRTSTKIMVKNFADFSREHIREGIEIAFFPFIPSQRLAQAQGLKINNDSCRFEKGKPCGSEPVVYGFGK